MSETTLAAADILDRAADAIEVRGWGQRQYANEFGNNMCVVGAVSYTALGDASQIGTLYSAAFAGRQPMRLFIGSLADSYPALVTALHTLCDDVNDDEPEVGKYNFPLFDWNDNFATDAEEVVAKLRSVALRLRAQTEADVTEPLVTA